MKRIIILLILCFLVVQCILPCQISQAQSFEQNIPAFGLYCNDSEVIKSGSVTFDITDSGLLSQGVGITESEYRVSSDKGEAEFIVPFISSAFDTPKIEINVNGQNVDGSVWYGDSIFLSDNVFTFDTVDSPFLDESISGTLYTVMPDGESVTISLSFVEESGFVYENVNGMTFAQSAEKYSWNLNNAPSTLRLHIFVLGDCSGHTFESSCGYSEEKLSCKQFVDGQYARNSEYYEDGGVRVEFFYSLVNKILREKSKIDYGKLFYDSVNTYRFNAYKFRIPLKAESVISYVLPVNIFRNDIYNPHVYIAEQKQLSAYPISYVVELCNDTPFLIDANVRTEKDGANYCAVSTDGFCFSFCNSKNPTKVSGSVWDERARVKLVIVCIIVGSIAVVCVVILIVAGVRRRKFK